MTTFSPVSIENTRKTADGLESEILRRIASKQKYIAEHLGVADSTLSRMKSGGKVREFCVLLAALGLKVVDKDVKTVDPKEHEVFMRLAIKQMEAQLNGE